MQKDEQFIEKLNLYERITGCSTAIKMREEMFTVLKEFCDWMKEFSHKKGNDVIDKVVDFVNNYYYNENINVAIISDQFNLTPNYLSLIFKQNMKIGLLDYISKIRTDKAKDLLKNTDKTLEIISKEVGYSNVRTFSRVFSKFEGVSPGRYRQI
jgi:YesN/AraC family two-component response regulator